VCAAQFGAAGRGACVQYFLRFVREIVTLEKQDTIHAFKLLWFLLHDSEPHTLFSCAFRDLHAIEQKSYGEVYSFVQPEEVDSEGSTMFVMSWIHICTCFLLTCEFIFRSVTWKTSFQNHAKASRSKGFLPPQLGIKSPCFGSKILWAW
jgi:hypothetical protein